MRLLLFAATSAFCLFSTALAKPISVPRHDPTVAARQKKPLFIWGIFETGQPPTPEQSEPDFRNRLHSKVAWFLDQSHEQKFFDTASPDTAIRSIISKSSESYDRSRAVNIRTPVFAFGYSPDGTTRYRGYVTETLEEGSMRRLWRDGEVRGQIDSWGFCGDQLMKDSQKALENVRYLAPFFRWLRAPTSTHQDGIDVDAAQRKVGRFLTWSSEQHKFNEPASPILDTISESQTWSTPLRTMEDGIAIFKFDYTPDGFSIYRGSVQESFDRGIITGREGFWVFPGQSQPAATYQWVNNLPDEFDDMAGTIT